MKPSTILNLRSLAAKINPPLPLNPRESQQLLTLLTSSFRQQLNREHPPFRSETGEHPVQLNGSSPKAASVPKTREHQAKNAGSHYSSLASADRHLESILTNPLLAHGPKRRRASSSGASGQSKGTFSEAQHMVNDPIGWFEEHVASGAATIDMARYCLEAHAKALYSSPDPSVTNGMKNSAAGSKVLQWMQSSGLASSNEFLTKEKFVKAIVPFLVSEGRKDVIWRWLRRPMPSLVSGAPVNVESQSQLALRAKGHLLLTLVKAEISNGGGINAAMQQYLQSVAHRAEIIDDVTPFTWRSSAKLLGPTGRYLTHQMRSSSHNMELRSEHFSAFVTSLRCWASDFELYAASLHAQRSGAPDCTPALRYLRKLSKGSVTEASVKRRKKIVELSLVTARLLLEQNNVPDAARVMDFVRSNFPDELGLRAHDSARELSAAERRDRVEHDETVNLQLLEGLDLR
ncbi:hypothetical protein L228DRAFT_240026 [Xylona heveae TC161]|uniref:Uncharacterized protein n=1 Tax=Xylona heveae (strain CBS 132557 / TC161) TaxID=1328760 RepID=A0A165FM88_XYLHT|nr:hypothetical protein L228DRAFT_240026 [Xylona heveae TC161]KZF21147.1 hypothetical protein L228DRAFT_240026 [Xylona heveae TC161]